MGWVDAARAAEGDSGLGGDEGGDGLERGPAEERGFAPAVGGGVGGGLVEVLGGKEADGRVVASSG